MSSLAPMAAASIDADAATASMIVATTVTKPIVVSDVTVAARPQPPNNTHLNDIQYRALTIHRTEESVAPIVFVMFVYDVFLTSI